MLHGVAWLACLVASSAASATQNCPLYHTGKGQYDPSGPILVDDTWHLFPDAAKWGHATSTDLIHWDYNHPSTGFSADTGSISVTDQGTFAIWPGMGAHTGALFMSTPSSGSSSNLDNWTLFGNVGHGGSRDPGRAMQLNSGWYLPVGIHGVLWFKDYSNGSMTNLTLTGNLLPFGQDNITEFECPDVFELDGKVVIVTATQGTKGWTQFWVGTITDDDLSFVPEYTSKLDFGHPGISSLYGAKTGTNRHAPFDRRVLFGFGGWSQSGPCDRWYLLPKELSISSTTHKLLQHPVQELVQLRNATRSECFMVDVLFQFCANLCSVLVLSLLCPCSCSFLVQYHWHSNLFFCIFWTTPSHVRSKDGTSIVASGQVEVIVACPVPKQGLPLSGVVGVDVLQGVNAGNVRVGFNFDTNVSFAALDGRIDAAPMPLFGDGYIKLHVFVDGNLVESFYGDGDYFIFSASNNTVDTKDVSNVVVNTAGVAGCVVDSWALSL